MQLQDGRLAVGHAFPCDMVQTVDVLGDQMADVPCVL